MNSNLYKNVMKTVSHLTLFNVEDVILDPSTRRQLLQVRMARVISKCLGAWKTVTDAKTQMIVRCAETDASTQCLVNISN